MMRFNFALTAALSLSVPVGAQAAETTYTFDSVTKVEHRATTISITGVFVNDSTPTTFTAPSPVGSMPERCASFYSIMLSHPGTYTLSVTTDVVLSGPSQIPATVLIGCALEQKP